jgi:hypothetical protein
MAKIISEGSSALDKAIPFKCSSCGCVFEIADAKEIYAKDIKEIGEQYGKPKDKQWVVCPGQNGQCKTKIDVPAKFYSSVKKMAAFLQWDYSW